ncbi:MAG: Gfo/Idh/MocA family oxidoreductase [Kiritimatiellaeota bacterium]|nr:Gfo/Idh/MocA family oxidoreductase [Kiritimatiellota bacterium]
MSSKVRIGIIGVGGIGKTNGRALDANSRGEVTALCDIIPKRMDEFEQELGRPMRKYPDFRDLCRDPEVDAVFVGTPNQVHVPAALEAVRCGKHVMCTKPLSDSLGPAVQLVREAEAAGKVNMMSLSTRFSPNCLYLKQKVRDGFFGDIYYGRARSIRRSGIPDWNLGFIEAGGGAFRDMGVHVLDAAWWLSGMPKPIVATGVAGAKFGPRGLGYSAFRVPPEEYWRKYDSDDYAGGFIRFENGLGLQVESFWASHMPPDVQVELFGAEGGATMRPVRLYTTEHGAPKDVSVEIPKAWSGPWENVAGHYIDCILDGIECMAPLRHGMMVQAMLEAVLRSAATGREVLLEELLPE